ncbi:MAG TPA: helix-turn-helix domain-containing protein [Aggregatilineales bacterium]|nr:helix-turn-helix domain-containing protein [Anaerolineales bacterium]HRE46585.1 helix-turn-helix domain-containing protein [Aggregatilineales bacterium]
MSDHHPGITLSDLVRFALPLNTTFAAGGGSVDRHVRWVVTAEDTPPYMEGGEFILLAAQTDQLSAVMSACAERGAVAFAAPPPLSPVALAQAESAGVPLLLLPSGAHLREIERTALGLILDRNGHLERLSAGIYQQMVQLASENAGLGRIIETLAKTIHRGVIVQDKHLRILHEVVSPELARVWESFGDALKDRTSLPEPIRDRHRLPRGGVQASLQQLEANGAARLIMPIVNQGVGRGYLSLVAPHENVFDEVDQLIIRHAAVVCALEMSRAKVISDIEKRARGHFLNSLMTGMLSEAEASAAIEGLGHNVNASHIAIVARWYGENPPSVRRLETLVNGLLSGAGRGALTQYYENEVRLFYAAPEGDGLASARSLGKEIIEAVGREGKKARVAVGIGVVATKVWEWRESYRGAHQAAEIARRIGAEEALYSGDIDIYALLTNPDVETELRALRDKTIGRLLSYDPKQRADLLQTLEMFLEQHGNHNQTASKLSVHRNTLFYRMNRIAEITGLDLDQPDVRLAVHLSLKIHRLLGE